MVDTHTSVDPLSSRLDGSPVTRRRARILAYLLAGLIACLWVLGGVLLAMNHSDVYGNDWFLWGLFTLTGIAYVASAVAIVRRQPSNSVGWLFFLIAGALAISIPMTEYGVHAIRVSPGSLPSPGLVLALAEPTPVLALMGIVLVLQLFPDGRPVSKRWGPVVWLTVATISLGALAKVLAPHRIVDIWSDMLSHAHVSATDPLGVPALGGPAGVGSTIGGLLVAVVAVLAVVSLFVRRKRADVTERTQLRWLAYVVGLAAAWIVVVLPVAVIAGPDGWAMSLFWIVVTPLVALGIPIAVGIAIVRYRLFDIDVVISKTIVYGALAVFITIVYVAIVLGIGQLAGSISTPALSAVAAAIVALAFQPIRLRVQRFANRLVYGQRATPYEVLSEFSERLSEVYSVEDVLPQMAEILGQGTGARQARVWLRVGSELRPAATWGETGDPDDPLDISSGELPDIAASKVVAVRHRDELLGALTVIKPSNEPLSTAEDKLVDDLASQAGLVLRNVRLTEELRANLGELRASRQRLVTAQDEERRRIERNIHDGAQQQLVAIAVKLNLARSTAEKDPARTAEMLAALQADATGALEDLRDLARGIYPPLLADKGLAVALEAQARKAPIPIAVEANGIGRYAQEAEAAVYFCALEALQNVAKYSQATHATVRLSSENGDLQFEVRDDGRGFDASATGYGTGLRGMADRLEALGGSFTVRSSPGAGTAVMGRIRINR